MDKHFFIRQIEENKHLFLGEDTAFRSAVLIPLVKIDNNWHIVFEVRSYEMRKQPGDISFPGGKIDPSDDSPRAAAMRETYEELGVAIDKMEIIGELSPFIPSSQFVVYPFVGVIEFNKLYPNPDEVAEVFTVPLEWLLQHEPYVHHVPVVPLPPEDFPYDKIANGRDYKWRNRAVDEWFFEYEQYTIWGLTAKILKHFLDILKK